MRGSPKTARRYLIWGGIAGLWLAFVWVAILLLRTGNFAMADFGSYYVAGARLANHMPIYADAVYLYPPLLAQLLSPVASALSYGVSGLLWFMLNLLILTGIVAALSRFTRLPNWLWVITPLFSPILLALVIGQVTIILLALMAGAWIAVKQDRRILAGILLALAAWIKVFPALLIVYFLWKRDWRVVRAAIIFGIVLGVLQIAISGTTPMVEMARALFSLTSQGQDQWLYDNASVFGATSQLFGDHASIAPLVVSPGLYWISRGVLMTGLLVGLFYFTARRGQERFDEEYALAVLTSLLISPTLYPSSLPPVLLTYFLLVRGRERRTIWFCTAACLILSVYCVLAFNYTANPPTSALLLAGGFYVLIATWGVNAVMLYRERINAAVRTEAYS